MRIDIAGGSYNSYIKKDKSNYQRSIHLYTVLEMSYLSRFVLFPSHQFKDFLDLIYLAMFHPYFQQIQNKSIMNN